MLNPVHLPNIPVSLHFNLEPSQSQQNGNQKYDLSNVNYSPVEHRFSQHIDFNFFIHLAKQQVLLTSAKMQVSPFHIHVYIHTYIYIWLHTSPDYMFLYAYAHFAKFQVKEDSHFNSHVSNSSFVPTASGESCGSKTYQTDQHPTQTFLPGS